MIYSLEEIAGLLRPILERYHARGASIFGSYARGEASSDSDLDVIVHGARFSSDGRVLNCGGPVRRVGEAR